MKYFILTLFLALLLSFGVQQSAIAHCEVPCGIYGDEARFEEMLEDHKTIHKAMVQIVDLNKKTDALSKNQLTRWVTTKESHATKIQETISHYFMAQRIKAKDPKYLSKLASAHAVMVAAMKCKQQVDTATADALRAAILKFYEAYEGKKPDTGK